MRNWLVNKMKYIILTIIIIVIGLVLLLLLNGHNGTQQELKSTLGSTVILEVELANDFTGAKVRKEDLLQGCFAKDCIPSIDKPKFESAKEAAWLKDDDRVFAIDYKGVLRAYPQRIMNWHEIVNDTIANDPIIITFCPLCGSAVAFEVTI